MKSAFVRPMQARPCQNHRLQAFSVMLLIRIFVFAAMAATCCTPGFAQVAPPLSSKSKPVDSKAKGTPTESGAKKAESPAERMKSDSNEADPVMRARSSMAVGDMPVALRLLDQEITQGNPDALYLRAQIFETGRAGAVDMPKAADLYKRGMTVGHSECVYGYARFLLFGLGGVTKDETKGRQLVKQAADKGVAEAQVTMGALAESGQDAAKDEKAARDWYEKAQAKKNPEAYLALARFYDQGLAGLTKDEAKGTECVRQAANLGSIVAANEMGVRYQKGIGILQDNVAAIGWFNLAAQKGLIAALVNLGNCYETGNGVVPSYEVAAGNYAAAAAQKSPIAQLLLGNLQEKGVLGKRDTASAFANFSRAAAAGYAPAVERRDALKSSLTPAELKEAESALSQDKP